MTAPEPTPNVANELRDTRTLTEIVNDVWVKAELLIRQEMQLAITDAEERVDKLKVELEDRLDKLKVELIAKAIGGAVSFVALLALTAAVILLLSRALSPWLAALIVALVLGAAGAVLLLRSMKLPSMIPAHELIPERAVHSVEKDAKAIKEAVR